MERKRILGIVLIVTSIILFIIVGTEIQKYVTLTGLRVGATATYEAPFPFHGPLVVLAGICAVAMLLIGLHFAGSRKK